MDNGRNLAKVLLYYGLIKSLQDKKIICPFHNDPNPSMKVDFEAGVCFCFGCQTMANAYQVVKILEGRRKGLNELQAYLYYLRILKSDKHDMLQLSYSRKNKIGSRELYDMAYDYYHGLPKIDWENPGNDAIEAREYMRERGFGAYVMNAVGAKITYNHDYMLIFPMVDNGKFKGWVCRTMVSAVEKKRKYLYNTGFSRATTLVGDYGKKDWVIVVEGYMDRLKFLQYGVHNVVAILGWKMTTDQISKLKCAGVTIIISALDNDDCGKKGTDFLSRYFDVIRFAYMPGVKDPGEMLKKDFRRMYKRTVEGSGLMSVLDNIKRDIKNAGANKGKFIYFREGQKIRIRFLQDMEDAVEVKFHDNWERKINFPCQELYGRECKGCDDDTLRTRPFYVWSVYNYDENSVQLFMYAVNSCSPIPALAGMYEEYGTITDRDYIISVNGKGTNKAFSVVPADRVKFRNKKVKPYSRKATLEIIDKAYPPEDDPEQEENDGWDKKDNDNGYVEMKPRKLYDLCKERGIEVVPRKPKQYYISLLEEYDKKNDEWGDEEEDDYDDEWGDEEEDDFMNVPDTEDEELPFA